MTRNFGVPNRSSPEDREMGAWVLFVPSLVLLVVAGALFIKGLS